jgi:hypothetical protein
MNDYQANLGTKDIGEISRWVTARRSAGFEVQPWEVQKLLDAKYEALNREKYQANALGMQEKNAGLRQQELNERIRMNDEQNRMNVLGLGVNAVSTGLTLPYLKNARMNKYNVYGGNK